MKKNWAVMGDYLTPTKGVSKLMREKMHIKYFSTKESAMAYQDLVYKTYGGKYIKRKQNDLGRRI